MQYTSFNSRLVWLRKVLASFVLTGRRQDRSVIECTSLMDKVAVNSNEAVLQDSRERKRYDASLCVTRPDAFKFVTASWPTRRALLALPCASRRAVS